MLLVIVKNLITNFECLVKISEDRADTSYRTFEIIFDGNRKSLGLTFPDGS